MPESEASEEFSLDVGLSIHPVKCLSLHRINAILQDFIVDIDGIQAHGKSVHRHNKDKKVCLCLSVLVQV